MAVKYSVRDIENYQKLQKRLQQLHRWQAAITEERQKLDRQERHINDERKDIETQLKTTYKALSNAKGVFLNPEAGNVTVEIDSKHYVSASDKEVLLEKILSDYQLLNAKEKSCPFAHVKKELSQKYGIETRSISNFFVNHLGDYELIGGNRNKAIVMRKMK